MKPGTPVKIIDDARIFAEHPNQGPLSAYAGRTGVVSDLVPVYGYDIAVDFGKGGWTSFMAYEVEEIEQ